MVLFKHGLLQEVLRDFHNKRILVIGDYYLDEYVTGVANKVSPEAPVLRMTATQREFVPGAAGNVAANFASLGALVYALGTVGFDHYGEILRNHLLERRVITKGLIPLSERNTGVFSRILLQGQVAKQHVIRVDVENAHALEETAFRKLKEIACEIMKEVDLVFIADYDESTTRSGLLTKEMISFCIEQARAHNILAAGMSRSHLLDFVGCDVLFLNQHEAVEAVHTSDALLASKALRDLLQTKITVLTRGDEGLSVVKGEEIVSLPSFAKTVVDVCGAGDSLSVACSLSFLAGATVEEAAILGNLAASVAVTKPGTAPVLFQELQDAIMHTAGTDKKIKTWPELSKIVQEVKKKNKKVVFTNGCFDLLHSGHIHLLEKAREQGDVLIVGINSDRSARENKGEHRPFLAQEDRLKILAALEPIAYVTLFDELTPIRLIAALQPDVLVKGGNYTVDQVVGKDIVESYGGKVQLFPVFQDIDADKLINIITTHHENV